MQNDNVATLGRTKKEYSAFAAGMGSAAQLQNDFMTQVVGISSAVPSQGIVAAMQNSGSPSGSWNAALFPLTALPKNVPLDKVIVTVGNSRSDVIGLGGDGQIYRLGNQEHFDQWNEGGGLLSQQATFAKTLGLNTCSAFAVAPQVFAVNTNGQAWVAAYQDGSNAWHPGFALPNQCGNTYQSISARPDLSSDGINHAIGLTTEGLACELALQDCTNRNYGAATWAPGAGALGSPTGLPSFTQLMLITGDDANVFHVIGLGSDGSVWDVDQYNIATSGWSHASVNVVGAGSGYSRISFYLDVVDSALTICLVGSSSGALTSFASYDSSNGWVTDSPVAIPVTQSPRHWIIIPNTPAGESSYLVMDLNSAGKMVVSAWCSGGVWNEGSTTPICS
jgi:hypothetical protein